MHHRHIHLPIIVLTLVGLLLTIASQPTDTAHHGVGISLGLILILSIFDLIIMRLSQKQSKNTLAERDTIEILAAQEHARLLCIGVAPCSVPAGAASHQIIHIPVDEIPVRIHKIESFRGTPIILTGTKTEQQKARTLLQKLGFSQLFCSELSM
jgi:hypothetical protein